MDWYEILGVAEDADQDEIRRAHRRSVRRFHPDTTGHGDATRFRQVQQAYEVLSDPSARAAYDRSRPISVPVHIVSLERPTTWAEPLSPPGGPFRYPHGPRVQMLRHSARDPRQEDLIEDLFRLFDRFFWRF